jgi:acyl dehydratase
MVANGTTTTIDALAGLVGQHLGTSDWFHIDQARINAFADATDDHQWIHVDPERAAATAFRGTIAHGYLTLSLLAPLLVDVLKVTDAGMYINYGFNKVRFTAPVPSGSDVRVVAHLQQVDEVPGGIQIVIAASIERKGFDAPVCRAETVARILH